MKNKELFRYILNTLSKVTGNAISQSVLGTIVLATRYLQGVGSGSDVACSGERVVFNVLKKRTGSINPLCVFDVGANRGQYLSLIQPCLADRPVTVHCFEPAHETFRQLEKVATGMQNVVLNNCALGKEAGEAKLFYDRGGSGLASMTKRRLDHFDKKMNFSETINVDTIDDYCIRADVHRIDLLKIDVEGHELQVLNGARCMLSKSAIGIVTFEFGGCNIDTHTYVQDFYYFFKDHGMSMARITPSGYLARIDSYREVLEQFGTTNFLCIPEDG
jgi:FkbM family methyltransferase